LFSIAQKRMGKCSWMGPKGWGGDERGSAARQWQQFLAVLHSTKNTGRPLTILKKYNTYVYLNDKRSLNILFKIKNIFNKYLLIGEINFIVLVLYF